MIEINTEAENYIANLGARILDEDYGFCYVGLTDTVYFQLPPLPEAPGMTETQSYYQGAFVSVGFWTGHPARLNRDKNDKDLERSTCHLAAKHLCYMFGITKEDCTLTPEAEKIVNYLDSFQPKYINPSTSL